MDPAIAMIRVQPVTATLAADVRALQVAPGQRDYVGDAAFNLEQALADPSSEAMAILADDRVIGFYRLDFAPNAVAGRSFGAPMSMPPSPCALASLRLKASGRSRPRRAYSQASAVASGMPL